MKEFFKSYAAFTRTERYGLVVLCALVVVLIGWRIAIPYVVKPSVSDAEEQRLVTAWEAYKRSQSPTIRAVKRPAEDADSTITTTDTIASNK